MNIKFTRIYHLFQRGLPHCHLLIILHPSDKPNTIEDIDNLVSAEIPNRITQPQLFGNVSTCMNHGYCGTRNPTSPCMQDGKCSKRYPKQFCEETTVD